MKRKLVLLFGIIIAAYIAAVAAKAQEHIFSVASEEVRVDVLVTHRGQPVRDLGIADFEIFDNGVRQEISYARIQDQMAISLTLVFDMSASVTGQLFTDLNNAAGILMENLRSHDHAALVTFNHVVALGAPLTADRAAIDRALDGAKPSGRSSLIDAAYAGLLVAESGPDLPLLIIFSDGYDTSSWLTDEMVLDTARHNNAVVSAVSTIRLPKQSFLARLAEQSGGLLYEIESTADLASVFLSILDEFRQRYLLTFTPRGVEAGGWHDLEVRVKRRSVKIQARPGYVRKSYAE
jgi:VWFA-related protein